MKLFPASAAPGRIGLDCDNTLIDYDRLFFRLAVEQGLVISPVPLTKTAVRDAVRRLPDGELAWRRLQAEAYGRRIGEATLFPGVEAFLALARTRGATVYVVSHKTRFATAGSVDLQAAALGFLEQRGLLDASPGAAAGLAPERVYFEETRQAKLARIAALGLHVFVDDLPEVLDDPDFPAGPTRMLFAPTGRAGTTGPGPLPVESYAQLTRLLFGLGEDA